MYIRWIQGKDTSRVGKFFKGKKRGGGIYSKDQGRERNQRHGNFIHPCKEASVTVPAILIDKAFNTQGHFETRLGL